VTEPFYDEHDVDKLYPIVIPYGYCHCGCGGLVNIVSDKPKKYIRWHGTNPLTTIYGVKVCTSCKTIKLIDKFYTNKFKTVGSPSCKECQRKYEDVRRVECQEQIRAINLKKSYGMTYEQYLSLLIDQSYSCKICARQLEVGGAKTLRPHVDHCHSSGSVRGILCNSCNRALGYFKDNTQTLANAIKYLEAAQV